VIVQDNEGLGRVGKIVIGVCIPFITIVACILFIMYMKKKDSNNKTHVTKKEVEEDPDTE